MSSIFDNNGDNSRLDTKGFLVTYRLVSWTMGLLAGRCCSHLILSLLLWLGYITTPLVGGIHGLLLLWCQSTLFCFKIIGHCLPVAQYRIDSENDRVHVAMEANLLDSENWDQAGIVFSDGSYIVAI